MGIPGFYSWLRNQPYVIRKGKITLVSSLALDFNALLHNLANQVFGTSEAKNIHEQYEKDWILFENILRQTLLNLLEEFQPKDWLYIAVDGVAVQGKMMQQRKRRIKIPETQNNRYYESNMITPGTDFMFRLDKVVNKILRDEQARLPIITIYSSHMEAGEGEHKIMDFYRGKIYRKNTIKTGPAAKKEGYHVLVSPDLDIIMLTSIVDLDHIIVAREQMRKEYQNNIVYDLVDIDVFRNVLKKKMYNCENHNTVIKDFILITMLIGNDFLPHHPAFVDVFTTTEYLLTMYNKCKLSLINIKTDEIKWENLLVFFQLLSNDEINMLAKASITTFRYPSPLLKAAHKNGKFYWTSFQQPWYERCLGPRNKEIYSSLLEFLDLPYHNPINEYSMDKMLESYLTTLAWNFQYYQKGWQTINFYWHYKYDYTPLFNDIKDYLGYIIKKKQLNLLENYLPEFAIFNNEAPTVLHQLATIMPKRNEQWLPPIVAAVMQINSPISDCYPANFITEMQGINKEHMALIILPDVDMKRIHNALVSVENYETELINYRARSVKVIVSSHSREIIKSVNQIMEDLKSHKNEEKKVTKTVNLDVNTNKFSKYNSGKQNINKLIYLPPLVAPKITEIPYFIGVDKTNFTDDFKVFTGGFDNKNITKRNVNTYTKSPEYNKNTNSNPKYSSSSIPKTNASKDLTSRKLVPLNQIMDESLFL